MNAYYMTELSIVVSVYNEEESIERFYSETVSVLEKSSIRYELVFVNDGSADKSQSILEKLSAVDKRVKLVQFTRNFGHEAAMIAGIDHSVSDAVICMDADLQHPPALIPDMFAKYKKGYDVINMARKQDKRTISLKALFSKLFYKLINRLSPVDLIENASDFFLVSGDALNSLRKDYRERNRFIRGLIQFLGSNKHTIIYDPVDRAYGKSKYSIRKLFALSFVALASFSKIPLQMGIYIGLLFGLFSIIIGIYSLVMFFLGDPPPGYTTIILFLSIAFSLQFIMIGIIGLYVGFTFEEAKRRPLYIVKSEK